MNEAIEAIKLVLESDVELTADAEFALSTLVESACYHLSEDVFGQELVEVEDEDDEYDEEDPLTPEAVAEIEAVMKDFEGETV